MLIKKTLKRDEWKELNDKKIKTIYENNYLFNGAVSLMSFGKQQNDVVIPNGLIIAKKGYSWLHIAPKNQLWWLTAMFDEDGKLFQSYFDFTIENDFTNPLNPAFIDGKLDLVIDTSGGISILDKEELNDAYHHKLITKLQYDNILLTLDKILSWYKNNKSLFYSYLNETYKKLKE